MITEREAILKAFADMDTQKLALAFVYAQYYVDTGVDITIKWQTATEQSYALEKAYHKGYCDAMERIQRGAQNE